MVDFLVGSFQVKSFIADGLIASYNSKGCTRRTVQLFPTHTACRNSESLKGLHSAGTAWFASYKINTAIPKRWSVCYSDPISAPKFMNPDYKCFAPVTSWPTSGF